MMQCILQLVADSNRPVIRLKQYKNLRALLDTGADYPIWTADEEILIKDLGAKPTGKCVSYKGFGGWTTGNIYEIPLLCLDKLNYPYLPIVTNQELKESPYQLILSATMFHDLIYEINNKTHRLSVTVPEGEDRNRRLRIIDKNGAVHILCTGENADC